MDQHSNAGHKQQPDAGKGVEQESGISLEGGGCTVMRDVRQPACIAPQPGIHRFLEGMPCSVRISRILPDGAASHDEGQHHRPDADRTHSLLLQLAAKEKHDRRAGCGQQRNEPDVIEKEHLFSSQFPVLSSRFSVLSSQFSVERTVERLSANS